MQVTRLSVTPVKGLALHHPALIEVTERGAVGDRDFYLVDDDDRLVSVAKTGSLFTLSAEYADDILTISEAGVVLAQSPVHPGDRLSADFFGFRQVAGHLAEGPWDEVFTARAGRRLRLVKAAEECGGVDVEPLTILGDASTRQLAHTAGLTVVDARRFRMLIEFDGAAPHEEDSWHGRRVSVGEVLIEVGGPVQRCAGTTRNPSSGAIDLKTLALIGDYRGRQDSVFGLGFNFGMYARTVRTGSIAVGDQVSLVD